MDPRPKKQPLILGCFLVLLHRFPNQRQPSLPPLSFLRMGLSCLTGERLSLLDPLKFRSQCQYFRFTRNLAWMFGIQGDACEIVPNTQPHQVIACELLACQAIPRFLIHLPTPSQILVCDPLLAEVSIRLTSGQHIPNQFQDLSRNSYDRLIPVHSFLHCLKTLLPIWVGLHRPLCHFHECPAQFLAPFFRDPLAASLSPALLQPWRQP